MADGELFSVTDDRSVQVEPRPPAPFLTAIFSQYNHSVFKNDFCEKEIATNCHQSLAFIKILGTRPRDKAQFTFFTLK